MEYLDGHPEVAVVGSHVEVFGLSCTNVFDSYIDIHFVFALWFKFCTAHIKERMMMVTKT